MSGYPPKEFRGYGSDKINKSGTSEASSSDHHRRIVESILKSPEAAKKANERKEDERK